VDAGPIDNGPLDAGTQDGGPGDALLEPGSKAVGTIDEAGAFDEHRIAGETDRWILALVGATESFDVELVDATGARIAVSGPFPLLRLPFVQNVLVARLASDEPHVLRVRRLGGLGGGGYELRYEQLGYDALDEDGVDLPAAGTGFSYSELQTDGDIDTFRFTVPEAIVDIRIQLGGSDGNGSALQPTLRVLSEDGQVVHAAVGAGFGAEPQGGSAFLAARLLTPPGPVIIEVSGAPGIFGARAYYVLAAVAAPIVGPVAFEAEESTNDDPATPEALTFGANGLTNIVAQLPDGDVDHFSFESTAAGRIGIRCQGESVGSGVRDLELTVLEAGGGVIATAVASTNPTRAQLLLCPALDSACLNDGGAVYPGAGSYLLRLRKGAQVQGVDGVAVFCFIDLP
jgi:hypothetical protein